MKKKSIRIGIFIMLFSLFIVATAQPAFANESDYEWENNPDGTVTIMGYKGSNKKVDIPETFGGKPVTSIGDSVFVYKGLTSVTIPSSVTVIGDKAFAYNQLRSVIIPPNVTFIDHMAFSGNSLESVTIPPSLSVIGQYSFSHNNLENVIIPKGVTRIDSGAFAGNKLTSLTIEGETSIGNNAFGTNKFTSVTIPEGVTSIEGEAFIYNDLTDVKIRSDQTIISDSAFFIMVPEGEGTGNDTDDRPVWISKANPNLIIYGHSPSTAKTHAEKIGYVFKPIISHSVTFNSNGGSVVKGVEVGHNTLLSTPTAPTKKGEAFVGWYVDESLQTPWDFVKNKVESEITLYAKWEVQLEPLFSDIENHWAKPFIEKAVGAGMITGYADGTFRPGNFLTRAQAASIIVRTLDIKADKIAPFEDIEKYAQVTQDEIAAAYQFGIVKGQDGNFNPGAFVTRAQLALMVKRSYELVKGEPYIATELAPFADIAHYDAEAKNAITLLYEFKIVEGSNGNFNPGNRTIRAHAAKILVNAAEIMK